MDGFEAAQFVFFYHILRILFKPQPQFAKAAIYPTITLQNVSAIFDLLHIDKPWNLHASNSTHVHTNLYQSRNLYGQMHVYLGLSSEPFDCNRKQPNNLEPNATPPMKRYERDDVTSIKASSRFDEWSIPGGWRHDA